MTDRMLDPDTWPRAETFRLFRSFAKPHYAITTRIDATHLMTRRRPRGQSPYRAIAHAVGCGLHAVPELRTRFRGETITEFARIDLSMTVAMPDGTLRFGYVRHDPDFEAFARAFRAAEADARAGGLNPNNGRRLDLAYISCLPWLDFTALDNPIKDADDCIPRISWGRIVPKGAGHDMAHDMAMTLECHHAIADGYHLGQFFAEVQRALDAG